MSRDHRDASNVHSPPDAAGGDRPANHGTAPDLPTRLSLVLPAKNERACIGAMLAEVARVLDPCGIDYEVIVVDDGSTDGTFDALRDLSRLHPQLRGLRLSRSYGKEAALLAGLVEASGDAVVTLDADLQHPPATILEMLSHWRAGARIVHGLKRHDTSASGLRHFASAAYNGLARKLSGLQLQHASDFALLDRAIVDVITQDLQERRRFYRGLTRWVGFPQASVQFDVGSRAGGHSGWSLRGLLDLGMTGLFSFSSLPLRVVTILGLITLAFAILLAAQTIFSWFQGHSVSGFATIEITLLFLGSSIMISLGIVGEYVGCIYDEIKRRPSYLVSERIGSQAGSARRELPEASVVHGSR